jgi:hypothetical protein
MDMFGPSWSGQAREPEAWEEKALERLKTRRASVVGLGQLRLARTDSQEDQGFEVGEAGGTDGLRCLDPGQPGDVLRRIERSSIVVGGIRPPHSRAGVEETGGDKVQVVSFGTSVDHREGACGPERGARFLSRGRL